MAELAQDLNPTHKLRSVAIPVGMVLIMWVVHILADELGVRISHFGLYPRTANGLRGILTMPFIHGSYSHLLNNSAPMLILGWALYRFYPTLAHKTLFGIWLISGVWIWVSARASFHIGASGLVYGLAAFLFLSGWLRREKRVAALSLLVAFMYGSLWWGILPADPSISWEGHLWGAIAGFALAIFYRKKGPQKPVYVWDEDGEDQTTPPNPLETGGGPTATSPDAESDVKPSGNVNTTQTATQQNLSFQYWVQNKKPE